MPKKILFVILDGVSDEIIENKQTYLQSAFKQYLDFMTKNGIAGLIENNLSEHPDSGISTFSLLGYNKEDYPGRGYLEALGIGLRPYPGNVYLRANFATVKDLVEEKMKSGEFGKQLIVMDRRAGRDKSGLYDIAKDIREFFIDGVRINFYKSLGYRGVVEVSAAGVSSNISGSDPEEEGREVLQIKPLTEDTAAVKTAAILNKFEEETYKILKKHPVNKYREKPANYILLREASTYRNLETFKDKFGLIGGCIAASPVIKGIARAFDMEVWNIPSATGDLKTDLVEKTLKALDMLRNKNFVILHIKGIDVAAHDRNKEFRRLFMEKIDREVFRRILEYSDLNKTMIVVASDHPTSSRTGKHISGFMPFTIFTKGVVPNKVDRFDEIACKEGPVINISNFMENVLSYAA